jgi:hypothetical protein
MAGTVQSDVLVVGGGLAGIVTALECLRAGQRVTVVDRDTPERLGGLARWAFGGMALVDTPLQRRMKIHDSPDIAYRDWLRFGELGEADRLPRQWGAPLRRTFVRRGPRLAHRPGPVLVPAGGELGRARPAGQRQHPAALPHRVGHLVAADDALIELMHEAGAHRRLQLLHRHEVTSLDTAAGAVCGATALNHADGSSLQLSAPVVVLAMGGINGSLDQVRAHWPPGPSHARCHAQRCAPVCRWPPAPAGGRPGRAGHPCRRDVELRRRRAASAAALRRPWPVADPLQVGAVAGPQRPAHRARAAGDGLRHALAVPARGGPGPALVLAADELAHRQQGAGAVGCRAQPAHPRPPAADVPEGDAAGQPPPGAADAARQPALPGRRHAGRAGRQDERAGRHGRRAARGPAADRRRLRRQLRAGRQAGQRRADPPHRTRPSLGPRQAAHLQACPTAATRGRALHRDPDPTHHAQEPGRPADRPAKPRARRHRQPGGRLVLAWARRPGFGGGGASGKRSLEGTFLPGCILTGRAAARSIAQGTRL